jgi:hypothetical protein
MDHENHDNGHHETMIKSPSTMSMATAMPMTFFTSTTTPLYTTAWKPTTPSHYALTCLFLVLLCVVFRALLAARCNLQVLLRALGQVGRRRPAAAERVPSSCCAEVEADEEGDVDLNGDGERYLRDEKNALRDRAHREGSRKKTGGGRGGEILLRALLDASLAVVSYLL